ncbi:MAG: SDR family NAD(P)-dependent oxidoreductase [Promethearchaeota archaeon]|jgi:NAD(P)-dependent dehydrogenase (short-subunit alcohol dehydrogenase family)
MIKDFKGKVAVITGGASGIGLGLAKAFGKRGMKLVLADIDKEALAKVSQEFSDKNIEVFSVVTDVSDPDQIAKLADVSYERFDKVNILCNNAGIGAGGDIRFLTQDDWDWTFGVNLYGVVYGIRSFLNRMLVSSEPCHIINTSSLAGLVTGDTAIYSASKAAIIALSERLALECFSSNVNISVLCPAQVRSNIIENSMSLSRERSGLPPLDKDTNNVLNSEAENAKKLLELGMDPEFIAELVIKAIEEDIFYIFTHPEYIPSLKARFERISNDTLKLYEGLVDRQKYKMKIFQNDSPAFKVSYPDYFIDLKPHPMSKAIFFASYADSNFEINISKISPNRPLEATTKKILRNLKYIAQNIEVISEEPLNLRDGTPAYETTIECIMVGIFKVRMVNLSVIKDDKLIRITITSGTNNFQEGFKDILYSLEFD